jgi:hypothetical protein
VFIVEQDPARRRLDAIELPRVHRPRKSCDGRSREQEGERED